MDHAYTLDTFKEKILGKQPSLKGKLELLEKTLHAQSRPAARQSALAEFLKREVSLKQAGDCTVFAWRRPDGVECTLELAQDDGDFDFFGLDEPDSPAVPAATSSPRAAEPPTAAPAEESDEEEADDPIVEETAAEEGAEEGETVAEASEESDDPETDSDDEADEERGDRTQPEDIGEADADEADFSPGALFATLAASLGKDATAVLTIARDGDNLVVTFTPHSAGDTAEHDRPFAVTAPAAELDHPTEGFITLIGATTEARKTLADAKKEYEAAVKAEADAKKAEADAKKKAVKKKTDPAKDEVKAEAAPDANPTTTDTPKSAEAPLFG